MTFSWIEFLEEQDIEFFQKGKNIGAGEIGMPCPLCEAEGDPDPSTHMGINIASGYWHCWRNAEHKGKAPAKLIQALLGCSWQEACRLGQQAPTARGFTDLLPKNLFSEPVVVPTQATGTLTLPSRFKPIGQGSRLDKPYINYLRSRHFLIKNGAGLYARYSLNRCSSGIMRMRLIFPFYQNKQLVGWTGRSLYPKVDPRYLTLSPEVPDQDGCKALVPSTDVLFNYDNATGGEVLVVTEGPFDAMKLDYYGSVFGLHAVSIQTKELSEAQLIMLKGLARKYDKILFMLDDWELSIGPSFLVPNASMREVPFGRKDPGDLRPREVKMLALELGLA